MVFTATTNTSGKNGDKKQNTLPYPCKFKVVEVCLVGAGDENNLRIRYDCFARTSFNSAKPFQRQGTATWLSLVFGAGDENRTHNHSLGSCCFATTLHLHVETNSTVYTPC